MSSLRPIRACTLSTLSLLALLLLPATSHAGPPLICHPFDIGEHPSLPWGQGGGWHSTSPGYEMDRLAEDTLALLGADTPVIVRMETLRRAAVYSRKSQDAATRLLSLLMARAVDGGTGDGSGGLAWFDAGYFVETFKQAELLHERPIKGSVFAGLDGYAWIVKAIGLAGGDAGMELGAAMVRHQRPGDHLANARRLAAPGTLLRRNLESHFPGR